MKNSNKEYTISAYPTQVEIVSRLDSIVNGLIEGMQKYIARLNQENTAARTHKKREMQKRLHREALASIPFDEILKSGYYREFGNYRS